LSVDALKSPDSDDAPAVNANTCGSSETAAECKDAPDNADGEASTGNVTGAETVDATGSFAQPGTSVCTWHCGTDGVVSTHEGSETSRNRLPQPAPNPPPKPAYDTDRFTGPPSEPPAPAVNTTPLTPETADADCESTDTATSLPAPDAFPAAAESVPDAATETCKPPTGAGPPRRAKEPPTTVSPDPPDGHVTDGPDHAGIDGLSAVTAALAVAVTGDSPGSAAAAGSGGNTAIAPDSSENTKPADNKRTRKDERTVSPP
jgi:hypothetical protein